jgi:hypothetical protein
MAKRSECTIQSSYHSKTTALSVTRYFMASSQDIVLKGIIDTGLASAFKISVADMFFIIY